MVSSGEVCRKTWDYIANAIIADIIKRDCIKPSLSTEMQDCLLSDSQDDMPPPIPSLSLALRGGGTCPPTNASSPPHENLEQLDFCPSLSAYRCYLAAGKGREPEVPATEAPHWLTVKFILDQPLISGEAFGGDSALDCSGRCPRGCGHDRSSCGNWSTEEELRGESRRPAAESVPTPGPNEDGLRVRCSRIPWAGLRR